MRRLLAACVGALLVGMALVWAQPPARGWLIQVPASGSSPITLLAHSTAPTGTITNGASINDVGASLEIVCVANGASGTLTDSQSNSWTSVTGATDGTNDWLYYKYSPTTNAAHTFSWSNVNTSLEVMAFKNTTGSAVDAGATHGISGSTTVQPGSLTPPANNELVVSNFYAQDGGGSTYTINSSFTITDQHPFTGGVGFGGACAYLVQTTAAAVNPTWGGANPTITALVAGIASFK